MVRKVISLTTRKKTGISTYLLRYKEAYILEAAEMDSAHGLTKDTKYLQLILNK